MRLVSRLTPCFALLWTALAVHPAMALEAVKDKNVGGRQGACVAANGNLAVENARLLPFGNYRSPLASHKAEAQRLFEQGLVFGWGFNFAEAVRSFRAAAQLDTGCSLCRWGIAWAVGPSINHDMEPAEVPVALDAIVQARVNATPGSRERALIDALAERYSDRPGVDADQLARSYAQAMQALANRYPDDADIAVLAAEALMNAHAYDYWHADGAPKPWTPQISFWLERALRLAPAHPGAHHYRIHLFEDSTHPEHALASAEQLGALAPIVGHLVHMPSHIFFRLGRYRDAMLANIAAVQADREYAAATGARSDYAIHNVHYLWASAMWSGDSDTAVHAANQLAATVDAAPNDDTASGTRQHFLAAPVLTKVRLGQWDDALAVQTRATDDAHAGPYLRGLTHFANGISHAARGNIVAAQAALASLQSSARDAQSAGLTVKSINRASDVLSVARALLQSAIASARGASGDAVRHAREAVFAEDRLVSDDPPVWLVPARHALGAALLRAGRATEAKAVYRADLRRHPHNCFALAGVAAADRKLRASNVSVDPSERVTPRVSHCPE